MADKATDGQSRPGKGQPLDLRVVRGPAASGRGRKPGVLSMRVLQATGRSPELFGDKPHLTARRKVDPARAETSCSRLADE